MRSDRDVETCPRTIWMFANPILATAACGPASAMPMHHPVRRALRSPFDLFLLAAALLGWSGLGAAQPVPPDELDGLLYTFASYTRWPTSVLRPDQEPLLICLLGSASLRSQPPLTRSEGSIAVRRVVASDDLRRCHLLFVPAAEQHRLRDSVVSVTGAPVLTVSDAPGALREGVAVELAPGGGRVQFEVNLAAAQRNQLVISSKLLRVARRVIHSAVQP